MRTGTGTFLVATAFIALLALAVLIVALGVVTALKVHRPDDSDTPPG
ncbi:hypothetical protein ACF9IK_22125 [Kitasatospora hibisci]